MSLYEKYVLPKFLNCACGSKPVSYQRKKVVPLAEGKVLEIGIGSGLNLPFYDKAKIDEIWGLDPCLLYTSPSPRDRQKSRMPSSA